jgi:hypothetical protein
MQRELQVWVGGSGKLGSLSSLFCDRFQVVLDPAGAFAFFLDLRVFDDAFAVSGNSLRGCGHY